MKTNQHGFTILEAVIGMLLASGLAVAIATVVNMSSKAERNASIGAEHAELLGIIRQIIVQPESCTANLKDTYIKPTEPYEPTPVELFFTNTPSGTPPVAVKTTPLRTSKPNGNPSEKFFGKIKIDQFNASLLAKLTDRHWLIKVSVVGEKTGTNVGGKDVFGSISTQVLVDLATSNIIKCLGDQNLTVALTEDDIVLNDKICRLGSNGTKVYDKATKACLDNTNCVPGDLNTATCPAGTVITGCVRPDVNDKYPPVNRGFGNDKPSATRCETDAATNSAKCFYVTDGLFDYLPTTVCKACCQTPL